MMHGVGLVCLEYQKLYREYTRTYAAVDFYLLTAHRQQCPVCKSETARLTEAAWQAAHPRLDITDSDSHIT